MNARHLTARFNEITPGLYSADSNSDAYGQLLALVDAGEAEFRGEFYPSADVRSIAVEILGARKAKENSGDIIDLSIKIGDEFYTRSLQEYYPANIMWWREVIQNSVDAGYKHNWSLGATTIIRCEVKDNADGSQTVSCEDNSGGMSLEVLQKHFLTVSASGKRGDGSGVGGFGIAKELILFPWIEYEIHTQDVYVKGAGGGKPDAKRAERLDGTKITVRMPPDRKTSKEDCLSVILKSSLPGIRFYVNGELKHANLRADDDWEIDFDRDQSAKAKLYHKKKSINAKGFYVRKRSGIGSLWMFDRTVPSDVPGLVILEVDAPSTQVFTSNRMQFRDWYLQRATDEFINRLSKEKMSALRKKRNAYLEAFGNLTYSKTQALAEERVTAMSNIVGAAENIEKPETQKAIQDFLSASKPKDAPIAATGVEGPQSAEEDDADADPEDKKAKIDLDTPPDLVKIMIDFAPTKSGGGMTKIIKHLAWQPRFLIRNEIEEFKVPQKFKPYDKNGKFTMSSRAAKLARFWANLCISILISSGHEFKPYGVGFVFDTEAIGGEFKTALAMWYNGGPPGEPAHGWILLNPFRGGLYDKENGGGKLYSLRDDGDLRSLYASAVHECAHHLTPMSGHDEVYASVITHLVATSSYVLDSIRKIRDESVKLLEVEKERKEERKALRAAKGEKKRLAAIAWSAPPRFTDRAADRISSGWLDKTVRHEIAEVAAEAAKGINQEKDIRITPRVRGQASKQEMSVRIDRNGFSVIPTAYAWESVYRETGEASRITADMIADAVVSLCDRLRIKWLATETRLNLWVFDSSRCYLVKRSADLFAKERFAQFDIGDVKFSISKAGLGGAEIDVSMRYDGILFSYRYTAPQGASPDVFREGVESLIIDAIFTATNLEIIPEI